MSSIADRAIEQADRCHGLSRYIIVKGQYDGFHAYQNAPDEVAFLKNRHRHLFKWEARVEVFHDDRELEFFMVQMMINREVLPFCTALDNLGSCEQQAERILKGLINAYGADRNYSVEVSEDGENAGFIKYKHQCVT